MTILLKDEIPVTQHSRLADNMQSMKSQSERDFQAKDEQAEEMRITLLKHVRYLEAELEDGRKQRTATATVRKKVEEDLKR
ncbi:hypothetical protein NPIL_488851 [Nephila pilipes]|uniref:Myosin tail domain-containing protein n=1 Tax=Nephila pilipes TaxID=299642 RepID=A0A8X6JPW6_NEPPI|nr:hypothetical protein NPIL_488851 [Nephila pilipes]